jgi:undecaprenyl pyrophosphate phosphatase UppP
MSTEEIDNSIISLLWPHIGPEEPEVNEESNFMEIMVKTLNYMNAPLLFMFLFKQDIMPGARLYEPLPYKNINMFNRIWIVLLISFIPIILMRYNYKNKIQTRRYTNSVCIWMLMFAVLVIFYSKPYVGSEYVLIFLFLLFIIVYTKPAWLSL